MKPHFKFLPALLVLIALSLGVALAYAVEDASDAPDSDARGSKAKAAAKDDDGDGEKRPSLSGRDLSRARPAILLAEMVKLEQYLRIAMQKAEPQEDGKYKVEKKVLEQAADTVEKMAKIEERLAANEDASDKIKGDARKLRLRTLSLVTNLAGVDYSKDLEALIEKTIEEMPDSEAAATASARLVQQKYLSGQEIPDGALEGLTKYAKAYPTSTDGVMFFYVLGQRYVSAGRLEEARKTFEAGQELYQESGHASLFSQPLFAMEMLGKPVELKGPTLDGGEYDLAGQKGKVVLIDFWATWCGPCVEEIPNVKAAYEKYHDQGFEVVGVSLDEDEKALTEFIKDKGLAWPQIVFKDKESAGTLKDNEVAKQFKVGSIPAIFLIGRDGKLLTLDPRGEALDGAVKKALEAK